MRHSYRNRVKADFQKMLQEKLQPVMQIESEYGRVEIVVSMDDLGICFDYNFLDTNEHDNFKPYFDGEILKRYGIYYVTFANIDRSGYTLDAVLQLIYDNVMDGVIFAIGR